MFDSIFQGLFDTSMTQVISPGDFLLCLGCSLILGLILALTYTYRTRYTKSFLFTLSLLPAVVCVVIMMVNGNIGTGVAVAGAFSLVRFRSAPGSAREIGVLFLAMGAGLIAGMGYLGYSVLFTLVMCLVTVLYTRLTPNAERHKLLNITIPEDLNYSGVFEPVLEQYTLSHTLTKVKTTNMGSLFRLSYEIALKADADEKALLDELRCRNGNLEVSLCRQETSVQEL